MVNKPASPCIFEPRGAWGELLPILFGAQVPTRAEQPAGLVIKFSNENSPYLGDIDFVKEKKELGKRSNSYTLTI